MRFASPLLLALPAALAEAAEGNVGGDDMNMHLQPNDIVTVSFFSEGTDPNECVVTEPVEVIDFDLCCACMTTIDPQGFPTGLANFTLTEDGTRFEWTSFPRDTSCGAEAALAYVQPRKFAGAECQVQTDGKPYLTMVTTAVRREGSCEELLEAGGLSCDLVEEYVDVDGGEDGDVEKIESDEPKSEPEPEPEPSGANSMVAFYALLGAMFAAPSLLW